MCQIRKVFCPRGHYTWWVDHSCASATFKWPNASKRTCWNPEITTIRLVRVHSDGSPDAAPSKQIDDSIPKPRKGSTSSTESVESACSKMSGVARMQRDAEGKVDSSATTAMRVRWEGSDGCVEYWARVETDAEFLSACANCSHGECRSLFGRSGEWDGSVARIEEFERRRAAE